MTTRALRSAVLGVLTLLAPLHAAAQVPAGDSKLVQDLAVDGFALGVNFRF
jgi:hypothetical protein